MRIAITGSSGLIGSALRPALDAAGHEVVPVVRSTPEKGEVGWDPAAGEIDEAGLAGIDAAIHLAGVGVGDKRWTHEHKKAILDSRVQGTTLLSQALAGLDPKPAVLISASAVGYYGSGGDEVYTEDSPPGDDFLAEVCIAWEAATAAAEAVGIRVAHIRTGIVLSGEGGTLGKMLLPFKLGIGGRIGSGEQYWSWISIDDEVGAIQHLLGSSLSGPVNLTAPHPVTNAEFTKTLGDVLNRPTILPTPRFGLNLLLGKELVDTVAAVGQRVAPTRLLADGFEFAHPYVEDGLRAVLGKPLAA